MKYGIITLTHDSSLYNFFDNIKRKYLQKRGILHTFVYNSNNIQSTQNPSDIMYHSNLIGDCGIYTMLDKFIMTLNVLKNNSDWNNCDHILRANSSTFLNIPILEKHIEQLPKTNCYAGAIIRNEFISGTCIIFSKDVIQQLSQISTKHEHIQTEDDLLISNYMKKFQIPVINIPMYWYDKNIIPSKEEISKVLQQYPLIRVRNLDRLNVDTKIWELIEKYYE